jgi:hypothetical protein
MYTDRIPSDHVILKCKLGDEKITLRCTCIMGMEDGLTSIESFTMADGGIRPVC